VKIVAGGDVEYSAGALLDIGDITRFVVENKGGERSRELELPVV